MDLFHTYGKEIVALLVPFVTWILNRQQRHEPKLIQGVRDAQRFNVQVPLVDNAGVTQRPSQVVDTASVFFRNIGKKTATKVEIVFNFKPMFFNVLPPRNRTETELSDKRFVLLFDSLSPGESIRVELLAINTDLPLLATVRCDQCIAKPTTFQISQSVPMWKANLYRALQGLGMAAAAYLFIWLIQFLVLQTPTK